MNDISDIKGAGEEIVVAIDEDLEDIVPGYLENRAGDLPAIEIAIETADYDTVRVIGHTMKGTGGGYGFDELTNIGARLEAAGKSKDRAGMEKGFFDLSGYLRRVKVVYVK